MTNVANEYGALLNCVVTSSESNLSLEPLAEGLMKRYLDANQVPPRLLYTDRDCCSDENDAGSRYHKLFHSWVKMLVRLDIWHWMKRIAAGALDSHPLYPSFLRQLSGCIFEWDQDDYRELSDAKREEMEMKGIKNPSDKAVSKAHDVVYLYSSVPNCRGGLISRGFDTPRKIHKMEGVMIR